MLKLDEILFGYKFFYIKKDDIAKAMTLLLKSGIGGKIDTFGRLRVSIVKLKKYRKVLSTIDYIEGDPKGLAGFIFRNRKRYGIICGIALIVLIFLFTSDYIWDVRVEGNYALTKVRIEEELAEVGLEVGGRWSRLSKSIAERQALENIDELAWININRRGFVAYVTVKEKEITDESTDYEGYCNVVAAFDCVIEEITVRRGIAAVKAGDTVKRGDLLISGIIPNELGGGFVKADGDVFGKLNEKQSVFVNRTEDLKAYTEESVNSLTIKIFGFSINIFKKYSNSSKECVIIDEVRKAVLPNEVILPIEINRRLVLNYKYKTVTYTDDELIALASARLAEKRAVSLSDAELLSIKTGGCFSNDGYTLTSDMSVLRNVAVQHSFSD